MIRKPYNLQVFGSNKTTEPQHESPNRLSSPMSAGGDP
jgi:hypothetical protein